MSKLEWSEPEPGDVGPPSYMADDGEGLSALISPYLDYDGFEVTVEYGSCSIECDASDVDAAKDVAEAWRMAIDDFNRHFRRLQKERKAART